MRTSQFRRSRNRASVDVLAARIAELISERQELREAGSSAAAIERNRVQLARAQWELGNALIDEHLSQTPAQTAA